MKDFAVRLTALTAEAWWRALLDFCMTTVPTLCTPTSTRTTTSAFSLGVEFSLARGGPADGGAGSENGGQLKARSSSRTWRASRTATTVEDLVSRGRDLERIVPARAVGWHLDRRMRWEQDGWVGFISSNEHWSREQ